jgi:drug/metabolite transporter (DMT)-like permease
MTAAVLWGFADFLAGAQARRLSPVVVTGFSQGGSLLLLGLIGAISAPAAPPGEDALIAALAGVAVAGGIVGLYAALGQGTMSVVAPIAATGAVIPVIFGLASGEHPAAVQLVGIGAALAGVVLVARQPAEEVDRDYRRSIALALAAAVGFGWFFVGMGETSDAGVFWPLLIARASAVALLVVVLVWLRPSFAGVSGSLVPLLALGCLDLAATAAYTLGTSEGLLSLVAVFGSLYAVVTMMLARMILHERINRVQGVGVGFAVAGVLLISSGS